MNNQVPTLAIVGHPNKGKSSIVSTLAQDSTVAISERSGTTMENRKFPMIVDGEELYDLVDTPGFQRARSAMDWMQKHTRSAADHSRVVGEFVSHHSDDPKFEAECQLLTPILLGAGILYVIDGSVPYGPEYDAEMEILRWTGRPSMALINRIGEPEYIEQWRGPLSQYFRIVRVFNAHSADFDSQMQLLSGFAELSEQWRQPLVKARQVIELRRQNQITEACARIADMLDQMLRYQQRIRIDDGASDSEEKSQIEIFQQNLIQMEAEARIEIEQIFNYQRLNREEQQIKLLDADLFSEQTWNVFGLNRDQLVTAGVLSGAAGGAVLDVGSGGLTAFLGSGVGALLGGATALFGSKQLINSKILGLPLGGNEMVIGPISNPNFPWVLLGRSLTHLQHICQRTHAMRDVMTIEHTDNTDLYGQLNTHDRKALQNFYDRARNNKSRKQAQFDSVKRCLEKLLSRTNTEVNSKL